MYHSFFIHSSTDGHLGCFYILVIIKNTAMNIGVLMFFQISVWGSFRYIFRSGITGSKGRPIFNFLKIFHTTFHSVHASLPSHQQCTRVPLSPHPHEHLLFVDSLMTATSKQRPQVRNSPTTGYTGHLTSTVLLVCSVFRYLASYICFIVAQHAERGHNVKA